MNSITKDSSIVRVSQKGQATIPKRFREALEVDAPGEVFVYRDGDRIVMEPVPTLDELHGIHERDGEPGEILEEVRAIRADERDRERAEFENYRAE